MTDLPSETDDSSEHGAPPEHGASPEHDGPRDEVIATALRWSGLAVVGLACIVGLIVYLVNREEGPEVIDEGPAQPALVQRVERDPPKVSFSDQTDAAGLQFQHVNGAKGQKYLPETMGPGVSVLDYDSDGDFDLLVLNGHSWDSVDSKTPTMKLFSNDGKGKFSDVTAAANLQIVLYGMAAAVGDYDGDGDDDLFVTTIGRNRLLRNDAGRFVDVTEESGKGSGPGVGGAPDVWSTSAGFFDGDNDGDLDLLVCNYVKWSRDIDDNLDYRLTGVGRAYGPPTDYEGSQLYYYENDQGRFEEVAEKSGLHVLNATGTPKGKALGLLPFDFNADGWIDIFVANDTVSNFLFLNKRDGTFEEVGRDSGVAFDNNGAATGAMGVDGAYYRGDLTLGIGVGNFATETSSLYVSEGGESFFTDESLSEGIGAVSRQMLSFGLFFFDYDLDGRTDLFQTNGHLEEDINKVQPSQHYEQPSQLFWNSGPDTRACFVPVDGKTVGDLAKPIVGRGAAYADFDGDGDLDLVVTQTARSLLYLRNDLALDHHWLRVKLQGSPGNPRAIGAWIELRVGEQIQRQQIMPTRSYLAQVEPIATFGLGSANSVDELRVRWPGATEFESFGAQGVDREVRIASKK